MFTPDPALPRSAVCLESSAFGCPAFDFGIVLAIVAQKRRFDLDPQIWVWGVSVKV